MAEDESNPSHPFSCLDLHSVCDSDSCQQQNHGNRNKDVVRKGHQLVTGTMGGLRRSAEAGCKTCAILFGGLNLPEIRQSWRSCIHQPSKGGDTKQVGFDEEKVRIEVNGGVGTVVERVVIIVRMVDPEFSTFKDRRYFNFGYFPPAKPAGCLVFPVLESFPVKDTKSKESFLHLKQWIDRCNRTHSCISKSLPILPKRVLKICGDKVMLYLRPHGERARYNTLSHTWGSNTSFTLTIDKDGKEGTLDSFIKGIPWNSIPKTFREAIIISRKLGIDYLWIDSLCIIQNDKQDWEEQSREMSPIYGNSWLSIAAADSKDSRGGCFRTGNADQTYPIRCVPQQPNIVVMDQPLGAHNDFSTEYRTDLLSPPLLQRGWVFQERLLPPRVVYYLQDELRWECNEMADCQCGGMVIIARFKPYCYQSMAGILDPVPFVWMKMIENYSWLRFTFPEKDRMIALAGVAKEVLNRGEVGEYLAGHWMQDLSSQLCWTVIDDDCRRPAQWFAPSWSWLSVLGTIEHSRIEFRLQRPSQIDAQVTSASCLPFGEEGLERVTSGEIVITGKILKVQAELMYASQQERPRYRLWHPKNTLEVVDFRPDCILDSIEAVQIKSAWVLFWGRMWYGTEGIDYQHTYMVLRIAGHQSKAFQRLGMFSLPERDGSSETTLVREFENICEERADIRIIWHSYVSLFVPTLFIYSTIQCSRSRIWYLMNILLYVQILGTGLILTLVRRHPMPPFPPPPQAPGLIVKLCRWYTCSSCKSLKLFRY